MNKRNAILFFCGYFFLTGFGLWVCSPYFIGKIEPWDGPGLYIWYYPLWLVLFGIVGGAISRLHFGGLCGISLALCTFGQMAGLLLPGHDRSWWILGAIYAFSGSLFCVLGVGIGYLGRKLFERLLK